MHHVEQVIVTVSTLGTPMAPMLSHVLMPKERISFTVLCTDLQQLGKNVAQLDMRNIEKPYGHNVSERLLKGSRTTWVQICQRSFLSAGSLWCRATDQRSCCGCAIPMYQIQVNSLQMGRNPCFACCSGQDKGLYSNVDAWSLHHGSDPKHRCLCCRSLFLLFVSICTTSNSSCDRNHDLAVQDCIYYQLLRYKEPTLRPTAEEACQVKRKLSSRKAVTQTRTLGVQRKWTKHCQPTELPSEPWPDWLWHRACHAGASKPWAFFLLWCRERAHGCAATTNYRPWLSKFWFAIKTG